MLKDVSVTTGFVGCVESLQVNSSQTTVNFDLSGQSLENVLLRVNVGEYQLQVT